MYIEALYENGRNSFVLISCDDRLVDSVIEDIRSIPIVTKIDKVQGMYDLVIHLKATNEMIKETIGTKLRYTEGVRSVLTLFVND